MALIPVNRKHVATSQVLQRKHTRFNNQRH